MDALLRELPAIIDDDSVVQVQRIGNLKAKITGARQALELSDDGVSQAANSLIELIDRSFRTRRSATEVIGWIIAVFGADELQAYTFEAPGGQIRPTKLAEALCFVAGASTQNQSGTGLHRIIAQSLVSARGTLH